MTGTDYVQVREVMTPSPIAIDGLATVDQAVDLMREKNVSSLVVDKRDESDEYAPN